MGNLRKILYSLFLVISCNNSISNLPQEPEDTAPTIGTFLIPQTDTKTIPGGIVGMVVSANDGDKDKLRFCWREIAPDGFESIIKCEDKLATSGNNIITSKLIWFAPDAKGLYKIRCTVYDEDNNSVSYEFDIEVGDFKNYFRLNGHLIIPRYSHTATPLPDGGIAVMGGLNENDHPVSYYEIYYPSKGMTTKTGMLVQPRANHSALYLTPDRILLIGGNNGYNDLNSLELVDLTSNTSQIVGYLSYVSGPNESFLFPSTSTIIVIKQEDGVVELIDANNFTSKEKILINKRKGASITMFDGEKLLITGGWIYNSPTNTYELSNRAFIYNNISGSFSATSNMNEKRGSHTSIQMEDGNILIAGGECVEIDVLEWKCPEYAELYKPALGIFTKSAKMARVDYYLKSALLPSGNILMLS